MAEALEVSASFALMHTFERMEKSNENKKALHPRMLYEIMNQIKANGSINS